MKTGTHTQMPQCDTDFFYHFLLNNYKFLCKDNNNPPNIIIFATKRVNFI